MPAKIASQMLNTEFAQFRSVLSQEVILNRVTKPYHLPQEIAEVVSFVDDIVRFPAVKQPLQVPLEEPLKTSTDPQFNSCGASCPAYTTPAVLATAYSFNFLNSSDPKSSVSVAEFQGQYCKLPRNYENIVGFIIFVIFFLFSSFRGSNGFDKFQRCLSSYWLCGEYYRWKQSLCLLLNWMHRSYVGH